MEDPDDLLRRLRLGREEYCQRLLTQLILGGPYPRWNTRSRPSEEGRRFLTALDELSFGAPPRDLTDAVFVDELDLGKRPSDRATCRAAPRTTGCSRPAGSGSSSSRPSAAATATPSSRHTPGPRYTTTPTSGSTSRT